VRRRFPDSLTPPGPAPCHDGRVARSILVVDDDAAVRGLVVRILRSWGHVEISEAGSVAEALACADARRPEVVLVDIGLPDGDGYSLTRQLRAKPWAMRVVLFSSDADRANVAAAHRAGAVGFLPKDELSGPALQQLIGTGPDEE
jgi:CheY-like chemotaxis protein